MCVCVYKCMYEQANKIYNPDVQYIEMKYQPPLNNRLLYHQNIDIRESMSLYLFAFVCI